VRHDVKQPRDFGTKKLALWSNGLGRTTVYCEVRVRFPSGPPNAVGRKVRVIKTKLMLEETHSLTCPLSQRSSRLARKNAPSLKAGVTRFLPPFDFTVQPTPVGTAQPVVGTHRVSTFVPVTISWNIVHPSSSEPGPDASNVMIGGLNPSGCSKIFSSFTACPRSSTGKEHRASTSKCAGSNPAGGSRNSTRFFSDLEAQMEGRDRAKVEDAGSSPAGIPMQKSSNSRTRACQARDLGAIPSFCSSFFATSFWVRSLTGRADGSYPSRRRFNSF
jgi:hypothetical protein